jgi:hypothetical protein
MSQITADKVMYIKLGDGGRFEKECIENGLVQLDYKEIPHELCMKDEWDSVHRYCTENGSDQGSATRHVNQIKQFYQADAKTMWVTFFANKLWWCFSEPEITLLSDGTKTRPVIGKWQDADITGKTLLAANISGRILKTQGYRGTICEFQPFESAYIKRKINGEEIPQVSEAIQARDQMKESIGKLIQLLTWKDFEILVDLIFRQAGWQRVSATGETIKILDLDLIMPLTKQRAMVQIKSRSDVAEFNKYKAAFEDNRQEYSEFFYFVHSPDGALRSITTDDKVRICYIDEIAEYVVTSGLIDWVIDRTA